MRVEKTLLLGFQSLRKLKALFSYPQTIEALTIFFLSIIFIFFDKIIYDYLRLHFCIRKLLNILLSTK